MDVRHDAVQSSLRRVDADDKTVTGREFKHDRPSSPARDAEFALVDQPFFFQFVDDVRDRRLRQTRRLGELDPGHRLMEPDEPEDERAVIRPHPFRVPWCRLPHNCSTHFFAFFLV